MFPAVIFWIEHRYRFRGGRSLLRIVTTSWIERRYRFRVYLSLLRTGTMRNGLDSETS